MAVPPGPVTVKVAALIDAGAIASLNVALSTLPTATLAAPFVGLLAVTAGGGVIVVKLHTVLPFREVPPGSVAPLEMVAV
jgi:hypothetical protein